MSFNYGGTTYYAKVSANTTTAYVNNKPMTISATQSKETYKGAPVYNITSITNYNGSYMFAESGYKLLTNADLAGKSAWELKVGRNEIYARHGRQFKDRALQAYFNGCSWYKPDASYNVNNDAAYLNEIELKNASFILEYEKTHQ
ncbi:MAG: YARHG domain-containing protein [Clostridia bacterium]|nr:YARHG domain-containing protein [Clostridia bacterium]